jgi:glycosyltransferase involved in cell wall biosynthesis
VSVVRPLILLPSDLTGSKSGGIHSVVRDFIKFAPADFEVEVIGATADREAIPLGRWSEVDIGGRATRYLAVTSAPAANRRARIPMALRYTLALLAHRHRFSTDGRIVNFHRAGVPLALLRDRAPKVQFVHLNVADIYQEAGESRWRLLPGAYHRVEDLTLAQMERIYVVNRAGVEFYRARHQALADRIQFLSTWFDDTLFTMPEPADRASRRAELRRRLELPGEGRVVLFVGRLEAQKDPALVVSAFAEACRHDPGLALVVVGSGGLMAVAQRTAAQAGIASAVRFVGATPRSEVAELMAAADALLLPSRFEGMPVTVLEALASGLAIAATPVGEVPTLVEPGVTGSLASSRAPSDVARALNDALAIPRASLDAACAAVAARYRAAAVLGPVYDFQRDLAEGHQPGSARSETEPSTMSREPNS